MSRNDDAGFTFIELLISLAILAMLFMPMMQLFSHAMEATSSSSELITAAALARREIERIRNTGLTKTELREMGDVVWPPSDQPPFEFNGIPWRVQRHVKPETDPLEITVFARRDGDPRPIVELVTLIEDMVWSREKREIK